MSSAESSSSTASDAARESDATDADIRESEPNTDLREREIAALRRALDKNRPIWICGPAAVGKTVIVKWTVNRYCAEHGESWRYVSCNSGLGFQRLLKCGGVDLNDAARGVVMILDDVDLLVNLDRSLPRFVAMAREGARIVFISRNDSLSLMGVKCVPFEPYTREDVLRILQSRVEGGRGEEMQRVLTVAWPVVTDIPRLLLLWQLQQGSSMAEVRAALHGMLERDPTLRVRDLPYAAKALLVGTFVAQRSTIYADRVHFGSQRVRSGRPARVGQNLSRVKLERALALAKGLLHGGWGPKVHRTSMWLDCDRTLLVSRGLLAIVGDLRGNPSVTCLARADEIEWLCKEGGIELGELLERNP